MFGGQTHVDADAITVVVPPTPGVVVTGYGDEITAGDIVRFCSSRRRHLNSGVFVVYRLGFIADGRPDVWLAACGSGVQFVPAPGERFELLDHADDAIVPAGGDTFNADIAARLEAAGRTVAELHCHGSCRTGDHASAEPPARSWPHRRRR